MGTDYIRVATPIGNCLPSRVRATGRTPSAPRRPLPGGKMKCSAASHHPADLLNRISTSPVQNV